MAGRAWITPDETQIIINGLKAGSDWATASHLVIGTTQDTVDDTFCDTLQTAYEARAAQELSEFCPGPAARETAYINLLTPVFTSVTPATGDAGGGETCVIVGTGFQPGATVKLGATTATHLQDIVSINPTKIVFKTVAHATEAAVHLLITNPSTKTVEAADGFAFTAAATPTFTSITPATGPAYGGTYAKIVGTNIKEGVSVTVGEAAALVSRWTATTIHIIVPVGAAGANNVVITNLSAQTVTGTGAYTYT